MFHDLLNLFYPKTCQCCDVALVKNEYIVCTSCLHRLPLTYYISDNENPAKKVFKGRVNIKHAYSLLIFKKKSMVQHLLHNLKYKGQFEISSFLGTWVGEILKENEDFLDIDVVIPVPLHRKRLGERGYNQVDGFGKKIAEKLNAEFYDKNLLKIKASKQRALKKRISRWENMAQSFIIKDASALENKNILLVDDILTTGATLEACVNCISKTNIKSISITTMAITI
ncbi:ComF family protein [Zunongwangia sp.]|uniref:ComF family protein n=1 Tax=Zunongwangia sp. TaxID=1965325 RepID=UPI003AA9C403